VWLPGNPIDFFVFLGFPIAILLIDNLIKRIPFPKSLLPIAIATFGTLLLLWLSGIVRGEVGRLWMYFGPWSLITIGGPNGNHSYSSLRSIPVGLTRFRAKPPCGRFTFYALLLCAAGAWRSS
jgi:hypothetical protein